MVLINASTRWSLGSIRLDNVEGFTSQAFDYYCMSIGTHVEHSIVHVHTQNGLAKLFVKRIKLIAGSFLMRTKLPVSIL